MLEFVGPGAEALSVDERLAVANMAVEAGSETGIFPADDDGRDVPRRPRARRPGRRSARTPTRAFRQRLEIDLSALEPLVALPHLPGNVAPVSEAAGVPVDQVYIGNCANGTMTDLRQAASILGGRRVHPRTRAIVVPATQAIWREAADEGLLDLFVEAGAIVSTPTCGACFGGSNGILAAGENAVATTNRNFRGRMGSPEAGVYLANAWVARRGRGRRRARPSGDDRVTRVEGVALVVPGDDVDTDVMYPGAYLNVEDPGADGAVPLRGLRPHAARAARRRDDPRRRLELRHRLVARARPARDAGQRDPRRRRPQLRADLLPQLHQPRARDRRLPRGRRRGARRIRGS